MGTEGPAMLLAPMAAGCHWTRDWLVVLRIDTISGLSE
jgi:hypothetical protein